MVVEWGCLLLFGGGTAHRLMETAAQYLREAPGDQTSDASKGQSLGGHSRASQHSALPNDAPLHFAVWNVCERDHGVLRNPSLGQQRVQKMVHFLSHKVVQVGHLGSHLRIVSLRELCDGVGVLLSDFRKGRQGAAPVVVVLIKQLIQDAHIFKACIHALAIEGHYGVRSIPQNGHPALVKWLTLDPREKTCRIAEILHCTQSTTCNNYFW